MERITKKIGNVLIEKALGIVFVRRIPLVELRPILDKGSQLLAK